MKMFYFYLEFSVCDEQTEGKTGHFVCFMFFVFGSPQCCAALIEADILQPQRPSVEITSPVKRKT